MNPMDKTKADIAKLPPHTPESLSQAGLEWKSRNLMDRPRPTEVAVDYDSLSEADWEVLFKQQDEADEYRFGRMIFGPTFDSDYE